MGGVALVLVSRFAFRLNETQLRELLELAIKWLGHEIAARSWVFDDKVGSLVRRVVFALPSAQLPSAAVELLQVPLLGENQFGSRDHSNWPDPVDALFKRDDW